MNKYANTQLHIAPFHNCALTYVQIFRCCVKSKYQTEREKKRTNVQYNASDEFTVHNHSFILFKKNILNRRV